MTIAANVIKEKIRRKDLYIIAVVSILISLLFTSSGGNLSIDGVPITEFSALFPVMLTVVGVTGCTLAIALSLSTIPNEYKRNTSHLIWIRGIKQSRYHSELAIGSIISSLIGLAILYVGLVIFCVIKGELSCIFRLPIAYVFSAIPVCIVSLCAAAVSIHLQPMVVGLISAALLGLGFLHSPLYTLINIISNGFVSIILRWIFKCVPNLYSIQFQGAGFVTAKGSQMDFNVVLGGLLALYLLTLPVLLLKKSEA